MNRRGQALIEYVILLAIVVSMFANLMKLLSKSNVFTNFQRPFTTDFAACYRYGHPKAKGIEEGGPVNIPLIQGSATTAENFRIFYNPTISQ